VKALPIHWQGMKRFEGIIEQTVGYMTAEGEKPQRSSDAAL
jgi:hypothetical protein